MPDELDEIDDEGGVVLLVECGCGTLYAWHVTDDPPPTRCALCRAGPPDDED